MALPAIAETSETRAIANPSIISKTLILLMATVILFFCGAILRGTASFYLYKEGSFPCELRTLFSLVVDDIYFDSLSRSFPWNYITKILVKK